MALIAYARVSTEGQTLEAQVRQLKAAGAEKIFKERRKPKLTAHQKREALARREAGEALTAIARSYDVSHSTISRLR